MTFMEKIERILTESKKKETSKIKRAPILGALFI